MICKISSYSAGCILSLSLVPFHAQTFLILVESDLSVFCHCCCAFWCCNHTWDCPIQCHKDFSRGFLLSVVVLAPKPGSLVHFDSMFVRVVRFVLCMWASSCPSTTCCKDHCFPHWIVMASLFKYFQCFLINSHRLTLRPNSADTASLAVQSVTHWTFSCTHVWVSFQLRTLCAHMEDAGSYSTVLFMEFPCIWCFPVWFVLNVSVLHR